MGELLNLNQQNGKQNQALLGPAHKFTSVTCMFESSNEKDNWLGCYNLQFMLIFLELFGQNFKAQNFQKAPGNVFTLVYDN